MVLLAEDEEDDVFLIRRAFQKLDLVKQLAVVGNGEEVISYIRGDGQYEDRDRHPFPDMVVLDHRMPLVSGLEVLFWLRSQPRFKLLPVLVLSCGLAPNEIDKARRMQAAVCHKQPCFKEMVPNIERGMHSARSLVNSVQASQSFLSKPAPFSASEAVLCRETYPAQDPWWKSPAAFGFISG
jgi:CheY-like chemotaxis protein